MLKREKRIYKLNNFFIRVNINKKNLKLKKLLIGRVTRQC